jgi:ATPase subunit of ABC transporter with duplicated ATPase domains
MTEEIKQELKEEASRREEEERKKEASRWEEEERRKEASRREEEDRRKEAKEMAGQRESDAVNVEDITLKEDGANTDCPKPLHGTVHIQYSCLHT